MKHLLLVLILFSALQGSHLAAEELAPAASVPEQDEALEQWVADLEPVCEFPVTEEYPGVILELFDQLIEQENAKAVDQYTLRADLQSVTVYGTQEEFCAVYTFSAEVEYIGRSGNTESESFSEMTLPVRMRRKDGTTYELVAQGGGPIAYGLEQTDLTLEDIR